MPNRLADAASLYLRQHADNPVDWYPWGAEALERAKKENKPIFLSIGYSACHWCHVMAHESFEDEKIAAVMNEHFVNIKVDREERPDLDQLYMTAVQLMTGRGGWPMSVFLTPELEPFYGGTYWPPTRRMGMPGFEEVLRAVAEAWKDRPEQAAEQARRLTENIRRSGQLAAPAGEGDISADLLPGAFTELRQIYDQQHGGFGGAPKFPHPMSVCWLLRYWRRSGEPAAREMALTTLDKMARGGIYDHLGGGFHRYSVDAEWLVPHFEKMLYDNALLTVSYVEAFQATGEQRFADVARETLDYITADMTSPEGGFYSTRDADSEGEEGLFYVWTIDELNEVLGAEDGQLIADVYGATRGGNFEGRNILHLKQSIPDWAEHHGHDVEQLSERLDACREKLLSHRSGRVPPNRDEKVLVFWNGLMIHAFALAGGALAEPQYVATAGRAADFLLEQLWKNNTLSHMWAAGAAHGTGYLDDYAALANALITLYEADFQPRWIEAAVAISEQMIVRFHDEEQGGFYYTAADSPDLIARTKDTIDSSTPSGNSLAATLLVRLGHLTGNQRMLEIARQTVTLAVPLMERTASGTSQMLIALDGLLGPLHQIVVAGSPDEEDTQAVLADLRRRFIANYVLALNPGGDDEADLPPALAPLLQDKTPGAENLSAYVCHDFTCLEPARGHEAILKAWDELAGE